VSFLSGTEEPQEVSGTLRYVTTHLGVEYGF
jgi:hypothetical protein